jgi:hypothetical protein
LKEKINYFFFSRNIAQQNSIALRKNINLT